MADNLPRVATTQLVIIQAETVGYSVQRFQPPAEGWTPLGDKIRCATFEEGNRIAVPMISEHRCTLAMLPDRPGSSRPDFRRRDRD